MIVALAAAFALAAAPQAQTNPRVLLEQADGGYCLATGFCPGPNRPGPASGVLFLAVGLIGLGAAGLRRRPGEPTSATE